MHGPAHQGPGRINRAGPVAQQRTGNLPAPGGALGWTHRLDDLDDPGHVGQQQVFLGLGKLLGNMVADEQGFRRGQFHLVITTGVTPGLAGDGVGEFGFGLKPPGQVIGQEKGAEGDFQGPLRHPALGDNRPDVVSGRGGDAWIDPGRGPAAPVCTFRSPGLGGFLFFFLGFWLILLGPSKLAVGNTMTFHNMPSWPRCARPPGRKLRSDHNQVLSTAPGPATSANLATPWGRFQG